MAGGAIGRQDGAKFGAVRSGSHRRCYRLMADGTTCAANPSVLFFAQPMYASLGQVYRKAWKMWGGGPDSGLYKSELDGYSSRLDAIMNTELPALNERLATVGLDTIERNDSR